LYKKLIGAAFSPRAFEASLGYQESSAYSPFFYLKEQSVNCDRRSVMMLEVEEDTS